MANQPKKREAAADATRFDDVLKRMLSTPPAHKEAKSGGKQSTKRKRAK